MTLTKEQVQARVTHLDWPECLDDLLAQWHCFIELGEYDLWHYTTASTITDRINEMDSRFIKTFFPEIADASDNC